MELAKSPASVYVRRSFGIGVAVLCLLIVALITWSLDNSETDYISYLLVGLPLLLAWVLGMIGLSYIYKSRREKKTFQWYVGMIINGGVILTVIVLVGINVSEIIKLFSLI